jgi:hypothetical protein
MNGGVLFEVVEEATGVSHDGRRGQRLNGRPDYTSVDDVWKDLKSHRRETSLMKVWNFHGRVAEHQDSRTIFPKWGPAESRLEGSAEHLECYRFGSCTDQGK